MDAHPYSQLKKGFKVCSDSFKTFQCQYIPE